MSRPFRVSRIAGALGALLMLAVLPLGAQQPSAPARPVSAAGTRACAECPDPASLVQRFGLRESATPVRERSGWRVPERIVVQGKAEWAAALQGEVPGAEVVVAQDQDAVLRALSGADVYIGFCTPAIVRAGSSLKWIQLLSAGADGCANEAGVKERGILITNAQSLYGPVVADHALALLLSLVRRLPDYHDQQRSGGWAEAPTAWREAGGMVPWELDGKTMLVIGLGGIGTEIARRGYGFGMRVKGTRNTRREAPEFVEYVGLASEALELARTADVVVNATPLTAGTRGMFDAVFFRAMKPGAVFINIGRGESVVTADLVAALRAGTIAGAGLDVTDPEPLPPGHPLWKLPNVVLTPHNAGASDRLDGRLLALALENLRRYAGGGNMLSVVDVGRGY